MLQPFCGGNHEDQMETDKSEQEDQNHFACTMGDVRLQESDLLTVISASEEDLAFTQYCCVAQKL